MPKFSRESLQGSAFQRAQGQVTNLRSYRYGTTNYAHAVVLHEWTFGLNKLTRLASGSLPTPVCFLPSGIYKALFNRTGHHGSSTNIGSSAWAAWGLLDIGTVTSIDIVGVELRLVSESICMYYLLLLSEPLPPCL